MSDGNGRKIGGQERVGIRKDDRGRIGFPALHKQSKAIAIFVAVPQTKAGLEGDRE